MRGKRAELPLIEDALEPPKMVCFKNMEVIDFGIVLGECSKCGTVNNNAIRYCSNCGEDLFIKCDQAATISIEEPRS